MLVKIRFLLEDGSAQQGELISPVERVDEANSEVETFGDNEVDILVADGFTWYATRVHISRISDMREVVLS